MATPSSPPATPPATTTPLKKRSAKQIRSIRAGSNLNDPALKALLTSIDHIYTTSLTLIIDIRKYVETLCPVLINSLAISKTLLAFHLNDSSAMPGQNKTSLRYHACTTNLIGSSSSSSSSSSGESESESKATTTSKKENTGEDICYLFYFSCFFEDYF